MRSQEEEEHVNSVRGRKKAGLWEHPGLSGHRKNMYWLLSHTRKKGWSMESQKE